MRRSLGWWPPRGTRGLAPARDAHWGCSRNVGPWGRATRRDSVRCPPPKAAPPTVGTVLVAGRVMSAEGRWPRTLGHAGRCMQRSDSSPAGRGLAALTTQPHSAARPTARGELGAVRRAPARPVRGPLPARLTFPRHWFLPLIFGRVLLFCLFSFHIPHPLVMRWGEKSLSLSSQNRTAGGGACSPLSLTGGSAPSGRVRAPRGTPTLVPEDFRPGFSLLSSE